MRLLLASALASVVLTAKSPGQTPDITGNASVLETRPLPELVRNCSDIVILVPESIDARGRVVALTRHCVLKGRRMSARVEVEVWGSDDASLVEWSRRCDPAVGFVTHKNSLLICCGGMWFEAEPRGKSRWVVTFGSPRFLRTFSGNALELARHVVALRAGREVELTAEAAPTAEADRRCHRDWLRGQKPPLSRFRVKPAPRLEDRRFDETEWPEPVARGVCGP